MSLMNYPTLTARKMSHQLHENPNDERFMAAAIRLAQKNVGRTAENPSVGAIVVASDGITIVGHGVTAIGGRPHAETQALKMAGDKARHGTAYVTLEPCAHYGKTPPCANALVEAGIARVVIGIVDPDTRVAGKGIDILKAHGIEVKSHVLQDSAFNGLSAYFCRKLTNLPEVTLKMAISEDGGVGLYGQGNIAISNAISHNVSHMLRARTNAIMVGISTVLADDPQLTCRLPGLEDRSPIRVVIDKDLKIPINSALVKTARSVPTWVICGDRIPEKTADLLIKAGVKLIEIPVSDEKISPNNILRALANNGISSVLLEGGAQTATTFLNNDAVDRLILFHSPIKLGEEKIVAPDFNSCLSAFSLIKKATFGNDIYQEWRRRTVCSPES